MVALAVQTFTVNPIERRDRERLPLGVQVLLTFNSGPSRWTETDAAVVDISPDGMFVRCDRVPDLGQRVLVGFMDERGHLCAAAGRMVRFDGWGGFGVRFDSVNESLAEFIRALQLATPAGRAGVIASARDVRVWIE
jgi:hypothetical protein